MKRDEIALVIGFLAFYLTAFGLYHLMVLLVNRRLPADRRLAHYVSPTGWHRLGEEYKELFPRGFLRQLTVLCAVTSLACALGLVGLRFWELVTRR